MLAGNRPGELIGVIREVVPRRSSTSAQASASTARALPRAASRNPRRTRRGKHKASHHGAREE